MPRLDVALQDVATALKGAGLSATVDPRNLNLPGVLVAPATFDFERLSSSAWTLEADLYLVARDTGHGNALRSLGDMLDRLRDLWPVPEAQAISIDLPNHGGSLPALIVTITASVTEE